MLAKCRSQFLLVRLGRCLKLFVSTDSTSSYQFASPFGLAFFYMRKTPKNYREESRASVYWMNKRAIDNKGHGRSIASDNYSDHSGNRLSQNGKKQQVKTATTIVYTFTAWKMWFRNYYVTYILFLDMIRRGA